MISISCNSSKQVLKTHTIDLNALFNPLGNSTCSSSEGVLGFLLYEGRTINNASDQFVSCVCFFFVGTCLYELIYSEYSILPPPKKISIPPETPCIPPLPCMASFSGHGLHLQHEIWSAGHQNSMTGCYKRCAGLPLQCYISVKKREELHSSYSVRWIDS